MNKEQRRNFARKNELVQIELELNALMLKAREIQLKINAREDSEENKTEFVFFIKRGYSLTESGYNITLVSRVSPINTFKLFSDLIMK